MSDLKGKDFLQLSHFSKDEIAYFLDLMQALKEGKQGWDMPFLGKTFGMLFRKNSTRTRISFAAAASQLGAQTVNLDPKEMQLERGETLSDTAKVLSRYLDAILIRTFSHEEVQAWAKESTVPVINGLTDLYHPTQALADFFTLKEIFGRLEGLKLAYVGDGNNMLASLLIGCAILGVDISAACPKEYMPKESVLLTAQKLAKVGGSEISLTQDPYDAVKNSHAVYTDVWTSMGQESEKDERMRIFKPYSVTEHLFSHARSDAVFLHCLPCHRGEEVEAEVADCSRSHIFRQAENRLHANKAILLATVR